MFDKRIKSHHSEQLLRPVMASKKELEEFMIGCDLSSSDKDAIVYFHVPFCDNICSFCSMNRSKLDNELDEYCDFLLSEIEYFSRFDYIKNKNFKSVYFGGGTPTVFKTKHLEKILKAINEKFNISQDVEFSFESTLHNLSLDKLGLMKSLGVNRYSIGIQTFNDEGRKFLNRVFSKQDAINRLEKIRKNFDGNLCIDIIYNYPNQKVDDLKEDINLIKKLAIDSVSFYSLIYYDGSKLATTLDESYYDLNTDKLLHKTFVEELLKDENFRLLEYTKIVRKNRDRYRYITLSHKGVEVLPIGIGAGGRVGNFGIFTPKKNMQLIMKQSPCEIEFKKFCNLFQYDKIKLKDIKNLLDNQTYEEVMKFIDSTSKKDYTFIKDDMINFTTEGMFWGNNIAKEVANIAKDFFIRQSKN